MSTTKQNIHTNISAAELAKQIAFQRNLHMARMAQQQKEQQQKQMYVEKMAQSVRATHRGISQNDVQKKQELQTMRNTLNQKKQQQSIRATRGVRIKNLEKIIQKYERTSWILLYVAAIFDDIADILTIPILSTFLSICSSLYINGKLWSMGATEARNKMRLKRAGLLIIDLIPIINWFPVSVWIVYSVQKEEKARVRKARKILKKYA